MKTHFKFLPIILFCLLSACKKESEQVAVYTPEQYLTRITEVKGLVTIVTSLTYNDKRQLATIKTGNELITYVYTGDKLTRIDMLDGAVLTSTEITYKDNYPSKGLSKIYADGVLTKTLNYDYMSNLFQTNQINVYEMGNNNRRLYYAFDNANIISVIEVVNRRFINYDYVYGERKNVLFNASIRWPLGIENVDRVSTNEVLSIKTETQGKVHLKSFSYVYDLNGMPQRANVTETDPPSRIETKSSITYTYEYL